VNPTRPPNHARGRPGQGWTSQQTHPCATGVRHEPGTARQPAGAGHDRGQLRLRTLGREFPHVDQRTLGGVRQGIADHLGWAVAVTASSDYQVVDRRRIALIEPGMPTAPIEGCRLDLTATVELVARVRASALRAASAALDELAAAVAEPIVSMSLRAWPLDFPEDVAVQRRAPYDARADGVMYRQVLAELAQARGWEVHFYNAKDVVGQAVRMLADRADEVLHGPRVTMGPPWRKDHRMALAATTVAGSATSPSR
jgi:hypothetical protein